MANTSTPREPIDYNPNHAENGILKFTPAFWGKPRWAALFVAIARQIQELEDTFRDIALKRFLDNATGAQLAVLGGIVGQLDPGLGEEIFRNLIRIRIRLNRSYGQINDLIEVMQLLGMPAAQRKFFRLPPAAWQLDLWGALPLPLQLFSSLLSEATTAGCGLHITHATSAPGFAFTNNTSAPGTKGAWGNAGTGGAPWPTVTGPYVELGTAVV